MLETKLKTLFDYQRLEKNTDLQSVIDEVLETSREGSPTTIWPWRPAESAYPKKRKTGSLNYDGCGTI